MSYRVRRRTTRPLRGMGQAEHRYLRMGPPLANNPFTSESEARATWREHREELLAEAAEQGFIPFGARLFEGAPGKVHPYEHLDRGGRLDG